MGRIVSRAGAGGRRDETPSARVNVTFLPSRNVPMSITRGLFLTAGSGDHAILLWRRWVMGRILLSLPVPIVREHTT